MSAKREKELKEQVDAEKKRVLLVKADLQKLQGQYDDADRKYKIEANEEARRAKEPSDMRQHLHAWLADPVTVHSAVNKICQLVKSDPQNRKKLIEKPTACIDAVVKAMQANPTNGELQVTCCNALAGLKMHRLRGPTGSNQGGKKAADAGALPALVHAMRVVQRSARTALQHVTADDEDLLEAAKGAGAAEEWLTPAAGEEEADEAE